MNGTWMTDAELKDILLTMAKGRAPKPKEGTTLGDALVRFTTAADSAGLSGDGFNPGLFEKPPLKSFRVTLDVIKSTEMEFHVQAESAEEASRLAETYGVDEDIPEGDTRYLPTDVGLREFYLEGTGFPDINVTTLATEEVPADEEED